MNSALFYDIPLNAKYSDVIERVDNFANERGMDTFMFRIPKSDLVSDLYEQEGCFIIMSPGYKLAIVNAYADSSKYEDYKEDVKEVIGYLYSKYEYREELGRFNKWGLNLISEDINLSQMDDLEKFWNGLKLENKLQARYSEILVALCSGSINDIKQVKSNLPVTLLEQVKQKIQAFDADQTRFIYQNLDKRVVRIQGLSGTGKTELQLHKLKELYQNPANYKIFVTCHNKVLADHLKVRIPHFFNIMKVSTQIEWEKRLWCANAWGRQGLTNSGLYRYICEFYQIPFYSYNYNTDFDTVCKDAVQNLRKKYANVPIPKAFDYILVDECQDFKDSFVELCEMVVEKQVYLAGDVFQSIFSEDISKDYNADFFLSRCYRTDPKTLMFAHGLGLGLFEKVRLRWLSDTDWEACGYKVEKQNDSTLTLTREPVRRFLEISESYKSIEIIPFISENFLEQFSNQIDNILKDFPQATVNDFCVIFLDSEHYVYSWVNKIESYVFEKYSWTINKAYETKRKQPDTLFVSNRNNVKGLEYSFVICMTKKLTSGYVYRNAIYTMLTRSFLKTILFLPNADIEKEQGILNGYNEIIDKGKMTIAVPTEAEKQQIEARFIKAKNRRSLNEIILETIQNSNISAEDAIKVEKAAKSFYWTDLQEEEIKQKLQTLIELV